MGDLDTGDVFELDIDNYIIDAIEFVKGSRVGSVGEQFVVYVYGVTSGEVFKVGLEILVNYGFGDEKYMGDEFISRLLASFGLGDVEFEIV